MKFIIDIKNQKYLQIQYVPLFIGIALLQITERIYTNFVFGASQLGEVTIIIHWSNFIIIIQSLFIIAIIHIIKIKLKTIQLNTKILILSLLVALCIYLIFAILLPIVLKHIYYDSVLTLNYLLQFKIICVMCLIALILLVIQLLWFIKNINTIALLIYSIQALILIFLYFNKQNLTLNSFFNTLIIFDIILFLVLFIKLLKVPNKVLTHEMYITNNI